MTKKNAITKDTVAHVAKLANLPINDKEVKKLSDQLSETISFVEQLNEINTSNKESTQSVTGLSNITRPDETEPSLSQEQALQNAKDKENGLFKVKAIFEE
ncbi:Asp-tRNA(Asn)/Glu-tRNA(Gln) amidotransferase subunit GatC [Candidatus Microgenomates bacterium]|nr:Asp-tRNA(Asn)/Glu-tRNA(Gln) amidotransferase subunit GatC [Candidatus Microgenomates bacterium]